MKTNIGGDRLGSGSKMEVELHNYYRSTHNLSKKFQSSLAPGVLYPAYVNIGLNGDKFDIDIKNITRTLPTQGPLFGAFKLQVDFFVAPIRLYQGILHNNPINVGMKMNQVKLPIITLKAYAKKSNTMVKNQIAKNNIWKYLGLSGLGRKDTMADDPLTYVQRKINAVPLCVYYDIFKNYYANKQETNAYVINKGGQTSLSYTGNVTSVTIIGEQASHRTWVANSNIYAGERVYIDGTDLYINGVLNIDIKDGRDNSILPKFELQAGQSSQTRVILECKESDTVKTIQGTTKVITIPTTDLHLQSFPLENMDKMRQALLQGSNLNTTIDIAETAVDEGIQIPYSLCSTYDINMNIEQALAGLCVKTYQSDLFNNWVKTEIITGTGSIAELSKVSVTDGAFKIDDLNLAMKVYNMLNRIAVSGGTYEDWQEAVYTNKVLRKAETPMYMGGYSAEVMFEEVISTAESGDQVLGSLGGRGRQVREKNGKVHFEIEEPSIIMAIASLTPRVSYSQGNKWYLTDLWSIDDLHKPALDGIGFQDLLVEQMVWTGTKVSGSGDATLTRLAAGKVPAWINYMTDVDECYGDFADEEGKSYMVLNRNYNIKTSSALALAAPDDITTYIDPKKYNYAFAYNDLTAQNFWAEIYFDVTARRLMSAKQIPNL